MMDELISCCNERLSLGDSQSEIKELADRLSSLTDSDRNLASYHSECRKRITNPNTMERLRSRSKRILPDSPAACLSEGPGRPSSMPDSVAVRPKRIKTTPKAEVCIFSSCSFCPNTKTLEPLHRVFSEKMGENLLEIKLKTLDDNVRTCVSGLESPGDAVALEIYYHRNCLRSAQRTFTLCDRSNLQVIRSVCDEQLLISVQNTLVDDSVSLGMDKVNCEYLSILKRYNVEVNETQNYRKHLKTLITERLQNVQFIQSLRKNESDSIVLPKAVSKAMELRSAFMDSECMIDHLKSAADILREEMMSHRNWSFTGSFETFENPQLLQFFLSHLLFGHHAMKVSGIRNEEVDKTVDVACQFLVQNTRSDRQVKHQPKKDDGFRQTVQTPLSIGLPLAIHSSVRSKDLVNNLTDVYIGSDYQRILDLEKRVEQGVLLRMKETGGFCLPEFVKKGVNVWFAVDNIDLLEDTPTGQNTFHGTVIVMNQRADDGEPVNQPLVIPEKLDSETLLAFKAKYAEEPVIKTKPIRFEDYQQGKRESLLSNDYTHTWELASYFATDRGEHQRDENDVHQETEVRPEESVHPVPEESILSVADSTRKVKKIVKEGVMPTWGATKSLLLKHSLQSPTQKTNTEVIAPLFKTSPTDYRTLYTVLMLTQGISAHVVGPERKTLITLDLDLYTRALRIQQSVENNWILRPGVLHIVFCALHALGKTIDGSGLDTCAIESGIYTAAALRGIYGGKAYKRGVEYHITTSLAIMMLRLKDIFSAVSPGPVRVQCTALKTALHQRNPEMVDIFNNVQSWYVGQLKMHIEDKENIGELAQFFLQYLQQVESLLQLISACRSGDWEGYLAALENNIKYFFAHDLLNYARLMPIHLGQMNALEQDDPATWNALETGDFVVAKSVVPFTRLFTDQTLEQEIKELKRHGGMVGLSQDDAALDRLVTTTPHLAHIVRQYLNSFPQSNKSSERSEHYQLTGNVAVRTSENARKLCHSIELHCVGNPFTEKAPLKSLVSSALVTERAKDDIQHFSEKGQTRFQEFVSDRLLPKSTLSVWDCMRKLKLKTYSNWMEKTKVRVGDKVVKLREERELLGRFLIIQRSRPDLVPKLEETIGNYEMSIVPRSLFTVDGSLYIPTDKASLLHVVEEAKTESVPMPDVAMADVPMRVTRVLIVDAMAVLQSMTKTPTMRKISDLSDAFIKRVDGMLRNYDEGRIVFDRYIGQSLKNKTRQKRAKTSTEYAINPEMKLTMSMKELLSSSMTKSRLTFMLAEGLLEHYSTNSTFKIVVVYDTKIKGHDFEQQHTHEEADTLIPNQVLASVADSPWRDIYVWSPDTDVLMLLLDVVSCGRLGPQTSLKFQTGKGAKYREIDVVKRVEVIGQQKCQGLIGLHNFTGADWGGKFVGISKKTWANAYMTLVESDDAINCFRELGEGPIPTELVNGQLPPQVKCLEQFVCSVYCSKGPQTLPSLRWELFCSKNMEGEMLPPTLAALLPHITRANYMAMRDKSYTRNCPTLPPIEENGWSEKEGSELYVPMRCLNMPAPRSVIELTKCGCKAGCKGRCSCCKNGLPCTPLCKCYGMECGNVIRIDDEHAELDDDE